MEYIIEYFNKKLDKAVEEKKRICSEIRSCEIELQQIDSRKNEMSNDETNVFNASPDRIEFVKRELDGFVSKKKSILDNIAQLQNKNAICEEEIKEYTDMIEHCKNQNESNSNAMNVLNIQELDRQRIARDIHDSVIQTMTSLVHKSEFCSRLIDMDKERAKSELNNINTYIRNCIDELRSIIFDLRPMSFDDLGLNATISRLMKQASDRTDMDIRWKVDGDEKNISSIIKITILRLVQEGCSNAIRHSGGTYFSVALSYKEDSVELVLEDDGKGIDISSMGKPKDNNSGFGLSMMKERVNLLGGKISISNGENESGTIISIMIPVMSEE